MEKDQMLILDAALLLGFAGAAAVMAGFAGVVGTVHPAGHRLNRSGLLRLRSMVASSLATLYFSLLPLILETILHDPELVLRMASLVGAAYSARRGRETWRQAGGLLKKALALRL